VFGRGRAALLLRGPARTLIHALKYRGGTYVAGDVEVVFRELPDLEAFLAGAVLVPVPLHPRKERERGYNQSRLIADAISRACGGVPVREVLRRVVDTSTQTRLGREQRQANLKNAFALASPGALSGAPSCVLVDDVFTTGSTLNACARLLRDAGCPRVDVLTLGHG
jgi:ComF family protein